MNGNIISEIYLTGTSTEMATGTRAYELTIQSPFLDFATVAVIFLAAFCVFKLFFKDLWTE